MQLYVDGVRVGQRTDTTAGEAYLGYWRVGGDNLDGWPNSPSTDNFIGDVDEVAIYPTALTQEQIIAQYEASGRTSPIPPAPADAYGAAVYQDEPDLYWRLGETSGTDRGRLRQVAERRHLPQRCRRSARPASPSVATGAAGFDGRDDFVSSNAAFSNPTVYSEEAWFKTTTNRGGKIIGFGCSQTGTSGCYDRHVYMQDDGQLVFGVWTGYTNTITTANSLQRRPVAPRGGRPSPATGMKLYVDGELVGTNPQTAGAGLHRLLEGRRRQHLGLQQRLLQRHHRRGRGVLLRAPGQPDPGALRAGGGALNQPPTAAFTSTVEQRRVTLRRHRLDRSRRDDPSLHLGLRRRTHRHRRNARARVRTGHLHRHADGDRQPGRDRRGRSRGHGQRSARGRRRLRRGRGGRQPRVLLAPRRVERQHRRPTRAAPSTRARTSTATPRERRRAAHRQHGGAASTAPTGSSRRTRRTTTRRCTPRRPGSRPPPTAAARSSASATTATGSSNSYDRHVYMQDDGQLVFGTYTGQTNTITSAGAVQRRRSGTTWSPPSPVTA